MAIVQYIITECFRMGLLVLLHELECQLALVYTVVPHVHAPDMEHLQHNQEKLDMSACTMKCLNSLHKCPTPTPQ